MWSIGLPATTNIGGSGKWQPSDTADLVGMARTVLCPDRDKPGMKHMETIAEKFPEAQWLYAFPYSPLWKKLPQSRPMPSIGKRCHELRINDESRTWRIVYRIDDDAIVVVDVFAKKTNKTPDAVIKLCQQRLKQYDAI
jgi:phage-related protein